MKYQLKHVCEAMLLSSTVRTVRILPYPMALLKGWVTAALAHFVFRFRVKEAKRRIRIVFGDRLTNREVSRIAWISWRNFVFCAIDLIRSSLMTEDWIKSHVDGCQELTQKVLEIRRETGKGAVLASCHSSWEMSAAVARTIGPSVFIITRDQKNPLTDRQLTLLRENGGIKTVQRTSSLLKTVIRKLRDGAIMAILPDVRAVTDELSVTFFGSQANVPAGMAMFARQAKVPILPTITVRQGWGRHHMHVGEPIWADQDVEKRTDWQRMTQEMLTIVEQLVMEHPEQWFWYNKRWILDPI